MAKTKYKPNTQGIFETKIWDGSYDKDGAKHRVHLRTKKSSAALENMVRELKNNVEQGKMVQSTDITFVDYAREWLETYKSVRSNNTKAMYANIINQHFAPTLRGMKLQNIRRMHLQLIINNAIEKPRTCQQIALTFKQVISCAVDDKYLPVTAVKDICQGAELPRYKAAEKRALMPEEVEAVKVADFTPMERTFVYIIYGCGLRRGEVLALKRINIDLKEAKLTVVRAVEFVGNDSATKDPKSVHSTRTVPMPPFLKDHLKTYLRENTAPYLIHNQNGSLMTKSGYRRMWESILWKINAAAGGTEDLGVVHGLTAHTFRHNYCANLCYQVPLISTKKIAMLMGDTEAMVLNVYNHIIEEKENVEEVVNTAIAL